MSTLSRFTGKPKDDNTFRVLSGDYQNPAYAANIALAIKQNAFETIVQPGVLTGPVTFSANVGDGTADDAGPFVGDSITFLLVSNGVTQTATFGTGFAVNGAFAVTTGKYGCICFVFNGTVWQEISRTITA